MQKNTAENHRASRMTLATLDIVYGDIGTSPLYAMRECFQGEVHVSLNTAGCITDLHYFVVQEQAAHVKIRGTNCSKLVVNQHCFGVQHATSGSQHVAASRLDVSKQ